MEDQSGKYIRLFGTLFFTFLGFIVSVLLVLFGLRMLFGLLNQIPWFTYLYMAMIVLLPAVLFLTVYYIFIRRTAYHPSKPIRISSYVFFTIAVLSWVIFLFLDLVLFFRHFYIDIGRYHSYDMLYLASNVGCIFLVGVMQALGSEKEKDWMERSRE